MIYRKRLWDGESDRERATEQETERNRPERDRETDIQTQRETERQTYRHRERQRDRHTDTERDRHTDTHREMSASRSMPESLYLYPQWLSRQSGLAGNRELDPRLLLAGQKPNPTNPLLTSWLSPCVAGTAVGG